MNLTNICDDISFSHTKSFRPSLFPSCKTLLIVLSHYLQAFSSGQFIFQKKNLVCVSYILYHVVIFIHSGGKIHSSLNNKKNAILVDKKQGSICLMHYKFWEYSNSELLPGSVSSMFLLYSSYYVGLHYDAICCLNARWLLYLQTSLLESQEKGRRMKRTRNSG